MGREKFSAMTDWRHRLTDLLSRGILRGDRSVPPGLRTLVGVLFMIGGIFGFLPILGFWMIPLGAALIALDIPPIRRRLVAWSERHHRERSKQQPSRCPPPT